MGETNPTPMTEELRRAYLEGYSYSSRRLPAAVITGSRLVFDTSKANMTPPKDTSIVKRTGSSITITVPGSTPPWLVRAGLLSLVLLTLVVHRDSILARFGDLGRYIRQKYDEFALVSRTILWLEHNYTSLKIWTNDVWLNVRYHEMGDKIVRLTDDIYFLPDNIQRSLTQNLGKVALVGGILLWLIGTLYSSHPAAVDVQMYETLPRLAVGIPSWAINFSRERKKLGSNSHYRRDTLPEQDIPLAGDSLVGTMAGAGAGVMTNLELRTTLQTMVSKEADIPDDMKYVSTTTVILESTKTVSAPEQVTDYWAPPKGKTIINNDQNIWCRVCEQFHCCELPY